MNLDCRHQAVLVLRVACRPQRNWEIGTKTPYAYPHIHPSEFLTLPQTYVMGIN